jgi:hypothetical protein
VSAESIRRELLELGPADRSIVTRSAKQDNIANRCTAAADQVVARYRHGAREYSCSSNTAKLWQSAWDGACVALGGHPGDYWQ